MQTAAVFVALLAAASASSVAFRVPSADSAVITSQQQGGNFAYSTQESQAYGVVSPVVSQVATTYAVQQPATFVSNVQQPATFVSNVQQPIQQVVSVQKPVQQLTYTAATLQQPIQQVLSVQKPVDTLVYNTAAVQQPIQQQQVLSVQKPVEQWAVQPQVEVKNIPVAQTYVASAPAWNQWYGNNVAPVQYAVVNANQVQTVEKPVQFGYSIQQGGLISSPVSQVVAPVTYTAAASVVEKGTPADTYKTVAGVSPLGFNAVYGVGQPWATGYSVVV